MSTQGQLRRSRDAVLGGVCSGIAEYLDVDYVVVRILFVALVVVSLGVALVPYAVLCVALPKPGSQAETLDVEPEEAQSDVFGRIDAHLVRCRKDRANAAAALRYVGSAHVPPAPPAAAKQQGAEAPGGSQPQSQPQPQSREAFGADARATGWLRVHSNYVVIGALLVGSVLLTLGISVVICALIEGAVWWQCWPLILVVLGFIRLAVPARPNLRFAMFASGVCLCALGLTLLSVTIGIVSCETLWLMLVKLWPMLLLAVAFVIAGFRTRNRAFIVAAACVFILFCILGLRLCALPGPLHEFTFVTPFGREYNVVAPFPQVTR